MNVRGRRTLGILATLCCIQLAVFAGFRLASRQSELSLRNVTTIAAPAPLAPMLLETRTAAIALQTLPRPTLVHVWATWCAPCREELPALIGATAALEARGVDVVLLSVDESWPVIDHYFAGSTPPNVARVRHEDARVVLGADSLPTTLLLDRQGRVTHRLDGAQPWSSSRARDELIALVAP